MTKNNQTKFTVTKDVSSNSKLLRKLERDGYIILSQTKIETPDGKIKREHLPNGVFGHTKYGECKYGSEEDGEKFRTLKRIIGVNNIKDAIHVHTHLREGNDYFVTEDKDILKVREELKRKFPNLEIRTPEELDQELGNDQK